MAASSGDVICASSSCSSSGLGSCSSAFVRIMGITRRTFGEAWVSEELEDLRSPSSSRQMAQTDDVLDGEVDVRNCLIACFPASPKRRGIWPGA